MTDACMCVGDARHSQSTAITGVLCSNKSYAFNKNKGGREEPRVAEEEGRRLPALPVEPRDRLLDRPDLLQRRPRADEELAAARRLEARDGKVRFATHTRWRGKGRASPSRLHV